MAYFLQRQRTLTCSSAGTHSIVVVIRQFWSQCRYPCCEHNRTTYVWNNLTQGTTVVEPVTESLTLDANIAARNAAIECVATVDRTRHTSGDSATRPAAIINHRLDLQPRTQSCECK